MESMRSLLAITWLGVLALVWAGSAQANEVEFDRYVVHYSVISTSFLSPEVARAYDLHRSRNRALVNVVIMKRDADSRQSVSGTVTGHTVNLNRQVRHLRFREVRDGDAYYHLAEVPIRPGEVLDFKLRVSVEGEAEAMPLSFRQVFYGY